MTRPTIAYRNQPDWSKLRPLKWIVPVALLLIGALTTYYTVPSDSVGVLMRFGAYSSTQEPGLHFKLPFGIDEVAIVPVQRQLKLEFGFVTQDWTNPDQVPEDPDQERSMVTGDLNAALVEWVVQYRISDPKLFLFHVREPGWTLRDLSEAVMREVIGDRTVDEVITIGRQEIETVAIELLRKAAAEYKLGVTIDQLQLKNVNPPVPVQASFNEVNKAQQDRESMINVANGDYNKAVPRARGQAQQKISEAEGYRKKRVNEALGDVAGFQQILEQYLKAPVVTRTRLYLETMKDVLPGLSDTWIVDSKVTQLLPMVQGGGKAVEVRK
ncbi:MAG: FtsH protease activity modulator HflK [Planctomycetes bacterium]|jgi:membrane protease subunit HflK|nr:FtsH protease activity modulator HflK [Planctomycetota bacterium]